MTKSGFICGVDSADSGEPGERGGRERDTLGSLGEGVARRVREGVRGSIRGTFSFAWDTFGRLACSAGRLASGTKWPVNCQ